MERRRRQLFGFDPDGDHSEEEDSRTPRKPSPPSKNPSSSSARKVSGRPDGAEASAQDDESFGASGKSSDRGGPDSRRRALSVSELNSQARRVLEGRFDRVVVEGEISNFSAAASGHLYFSLKDDKSQLSAAMWRSATRRLEFRPEDGQAVRAEGRLTIYEAGGRYQMIVDRLELAGLGELERRFRQLKDDFQARGYFDAEHKRPLPFLPRRIGIVSSARGAAIRDITTTIHRRFPRAALLVADCRVQGESAAPEIAFGIRNLARVDDVDVLIVGRGGGSLEDLWAFNDPRVVEAIHECPVPIISAVGHEVDFTLADFVADHRAPTPTAAGEMVVTEEAGLREFFERQQSALSRELTWRLEKLRHRLEKCASSWALREPVHLVGRAAQRVDELARRLPTALFDRAEETGRELDRLEERLRVQAPSRRFEQERERVTSLARASHAALQRRLERARLALAERERLLSGLSPLAILDRGYSLTRDADTGEIVRVAAELEPGRVVETRLAEGTFQSRVEAEEEKPKG